MDNIKIQHYFLLAILSGVVFFTFFILRPFIYVVVLALVCVTVFHPIHQKVLYFLRNRQGLAALVTTVIIILTILVPFIFLGIKVFQEAQQSYLFVISDSGKGAFINIFNGSVSSFQKYVPLKQKFFIDSIDLDQYIGQGLQWLINRFGYIFGSVTKLLFNFFVFIITTYYLLRDGSKIKKIAVSLSPLTDNNDETILQKIHIAINSVVRGSLIISLIQGALAAVGFILFGVPNAVLWGTATALAALVPAVGTAIVLVPAIIFVFLTGNTFLAFGLLVWSITLVGLIDNLLRPILIGKEIKIHPLIVFLSVIGGIVFFGPIGFLLGPLTISLLFALLDIYISLRNNKAVV